VTLSRRGLIRHVLVALGIGPTFVQGPLRRARDSRAGVGAEAAAATTSLSSRELNDLVAFAELLVRGRPLPGDDREAFALEIEARAARDPEYLSLYRTTVTLLERLAGRGFSSLDVPARTALMSRHHLDSPHVRPGDALGPFADDVRLVRTRALRDLIADYYGSPAGWAVVGYDTFPGKCGDLERYTRPER